MALDHLLAVLEAEADAEAARVLDEARQTADQTRRRCEADLAERRRRDRQSLESQRATEVEFALVAARRHARREELEARERLLARVLDSARNRLVTLLRTPELGNAIGALVGPALECLATRSATIRAHPDLTELLQQAVGNWTGVRVLPDPRIGTGFCLTSDDGSLKIDVTLEARMAGMSRVLRQEILKHLEKRP